MSKPNIFKNIDTSIDLKTLEDHYLGNTLNEFASNCLNNKIIDMLDFRIKYNRYYVFPKRLFFFDSHINYTIKESIEDIKKCELNNYKISDLLKNNFPNFIFIIDYFCFSTFPSMFGYFSSQECIKDGFNFIERSINDSNISPLLICSFFLHSTVFQDRIMTFFYTNLANSILEKNEKEPKAKIFDLSKFTNDDLKLKFIDSFRKCLSYLSEYHFSIIKQLKKNCKYLAILTLTKIIKSMLKIWKYYPFFENFNILNKFGLIENIFPIQKSCIYEDIAKIIKKNIQTKDIETMLDFFDEYTYFHVYASDKIAIYKNNLNLIFSNSDIEVITKLSSSLKGGKIDISNMTIDQFIANSMIIMQGQRKHEFLNRDRLTSLEKMSSTDFHTELTNFSSSLSELHFCTVHSSRIMKLKLFRFAEKVLLPSNNNSPIDFAKDQLISYAIDIYKDCFEGNNINFESGIENIKNKTASIISERIDNENESHKKGSFYVSKKIVKYVFNKASILIQNSNLESHLTNERPSQNVPAFFVAADDLSWYLFLLKLSSKKVNILLKDKNGIPEKKFDMLKFLNSYTNEYKDNDPQRNSIESIASDIFSNSIEIASIIYISNEQMKIEFDQEIGLFNFGKKIRTFMKIYDSIEKSIYKTQLVYQENRKYIDYFIYEFYKNTMERTNMNSNSQKEDTNKKDEIKLHLAYFKLNLVISLRIIEKIFLNVKEKNTEIKQYLPMKFFEAKKQLKDLLIFFNMNENGPIDENQSPSYFSIDISIDETL